MSGIIKNVRFAQVYLLVKGTVNVISSDRKASGILISPKQFSAVKSQFSSETTVENNQFSKL